MVPRNRSRPYNGSSPLLVVAGAANGSLLVLLARWLVGGGGPKMPGASKLSALKLARLRSTGASKFNSNVW